MASFWLPSLLSENMLLVGTANISWNTLALDYQVPFHFPVNGIADLAVGSEY